ncbi:MAG TPA: SMP-30/gluconolactonase/LRE family protein [Ktedonobacteraceae bacterium]|nr:SMP-30/gluconolactonase/LRE family protein [Ktedonobacteraceae bacterium]
MIGNMTPNLEHLLASRDRVGESPLWSVEEQTLYWVDILGCRFHRYHQPSGTWDTYTVDASVGALALRASGGLVLATGKGFALYDVSTKTISWLAQPELDPARMRFNDGKVDCRGRFWAGTMSLMAADWNLMQGSLYRLDSDSTVHRMDTAYALINGIGWSPDDTRMYVVDSVQRAIYLYDFDADTGAIAYRRTFLDTSHEMGVPDGLTVDSEGAIWVAYWDGWKIVRYDSEGKRLSQVDLPVQCPTSCAFGGRDLDECYIASAWEELNEEQKASQPLAGDLFKIRPGVKGIPSPLFRG